MPEGMQQRLHQHLFPGDRDEHGAVIAAGLAATPRGVRLLARDLHLAVDGHDYVSGVRGYKMLKANFVRDRILECADERLVYLAVHNHLGRDEVEFSIDDLNSHQRGYPALLDIARGLPVGALVFAENAVAGDIWLPDGRRVDLTDMHIVGSRIKRLVPKLHRRTTVANIRYDRQARLFGDAGQHIIRAAKVGIIGVGGVGSLIAEYLAHLGVGHLVLIDPDRISISNLPRVVGSTPLDALSWLAQEGNPHWVRKLAERRSKPKVRIAERMVHRIDPAIRVDAIFGNALHPDNAAKLTECDYIFLAADSMGARLLFNAIVHQYLIPGAQLGSKVQVEPLSGEVLDAFSVVRPVTPERGCLWCNGLINPGKLQEEGQTALERQRQRYIDEPEVVAPSVITMNAVAAAHAVNDFMFAITGLTSTAADTGYRRFRGPEREAWEDEPRVSLDCPECGRRGRGRFAKGDDWHLPTWAK